VAARGRGQRESTHLNLHIIELAMAQPRALGPPRVTLPMTINVTPACLADEAFVAASSSLFAQPVPPGAGSSS